MLYANENDSMGQAVSALISKAIPVNQSLKEEDFDYYVEDLQDQIITHFNYHRLQEVPEFIDKMIQATMNGAKTDDKKRRFAAAVCLATLVNLFPFDDNIPQLEPTTKYSSIASTTKYSSIEPTTKYSSIESTTKATTISKTCISTNSKKCTWSISKNNDSGTTTVSTAPTAT